MSISTFDTLSTFLLPIVLYFYVSKFLDAELLLVLEYFYNVVLPLSLNKRI